MSRCCLCADASATCSNLTLPKCTKGRSVAAGAGTPSERPHELVAASRDALETEPRRTGTRSIDSC